MAIVLLVSCAKKSHEIKSTSYTIQLYTKPSLEYFRSSILNGDVTAFDRYISNGINVNQKGSGGWAPLMSASLSGRIEFAKKLIQRGANVNEKANDGTTGKRNKYPCGKEKQ